MGDEQWIRSKRGTMIIRLEGIPTWKTGTLVVSVPALFTINA
ncbi:MAG: hypothetical protein QW514_10230 [Thermoprotei archaeon]